MAFQAELELHNGKIISIDLRSEGRLVDSLNHPNLAVFGGDKLREKALLNGRIKNEEELLSAKTDQQQDNNSILNPTQIHKNTDILLFCKGG